jgi:manganese/zinc/iron transport system substrate-binding protein
MLLLALVAVGCGDVDDRSAGRAASSDGIVRVTTTTNFVTDTVRRVGGDRVEVTGLMGPGVDPHLYKASAGDVQTLREADLVVYVGLFLEGKMQEVLERVGESRPVAALTRDMPRDELLDPPSGAPEEEEYDPHVWFDPELWIRGIETVADELSEVDPSGAATYRANARAYADEVRATDAELKALIRKVPARARVLVTSHDAFRYFGRHFGFEVSAIQGLSTAAEATTADVKRVAAVIAQRGLRSIFVESSVPRQTIEAVIAEAGRRGQSTRIGGELFSDAAGSAGTPEGTYLGMLRANVEAIVEGLS